MKKLIVLIAVLAVMGSMAFADEASANEASANLIVAGRILGVNYVQTEVLNLFAPSTDDLFAGIDGEEVDAVGGFVVVGGSIPADTYETDEPGKHAAANMELENRKIRAMRPDEAYEYVKAARLDMCGYIEQIVACLAPWTWIKMGYYNSHLAER